MRHTRLTVVSALIVLCCALTASSANAQYVDTTASCLLCHQSTLPQNDFCSLVPANVWARNDKHNRAFFLLHETDPADPQKGAAKRELVKQILGFDLRDAFSDERFLRLKEDDDPETIRKVSMVKACLRCHATWPTETDERFAHSPPVPLALGVSCQACHGPGEKWETPHRLTAWRLVTPEAKAALGCADVRTQTQKAMLCASCHVGDVAQEKFVKHEWYVGGHPPLPGFELAAFESQMPMHWKPLREKGAFAFRDAMPRDDGGLIAGQIAALQRAGVPAEAIKASYREANFSGAAARGLDPTSDLPNTKDAIVGGVAVLETYVRLLGEYADGAAANTRTWPELALYDCTACHHELRSGLGLRNRPQRDSIPGRPPLALWPQALTRLGVHQIAGHDSAQVQERWSGLHTQLARLEEAVTSRPFGDPAAIRVAATPLAESLRELAADATATRYDETAARKSLTLLTDPSQVETNDFYTARQVAWAVRQMARDLGAAETSDSFFHGQDDALALELPSGPERSVMDNLNRWLPAAARYDANWFREELQAVRTKFGVK